LATNSVTLLNGTTADANDVENKVNPLYSDIDETNVDQTAIMVLTNVAQNLSGVKTIISGGRLDFSTIANSLLLPSGTPSVSRSAAYINNQLNVYDGSNIRFWSPIDKASLGIHNLGLKLSGGAISIAGLGNTALAASNAAWISYPSATAGVWLSQTLTADQTIASGGLKGRWGTTASVAWGSDMPLAIGVCSKDDTASGIRFFLTRNPAMTTTPASTNNIGIDGTAPATADQGNIVLFGSAANTGYNSRPCRIIGGVRATCDNSAGGVWTITALDNGDGIGNFYNFGPRTFTMPIAQHGGGGTAPAAGKYVLTNGGTAPVFTTNSLLYSIDLFGYCDYNFFLDADGGTDGASAVTASLTIPFSKAHAANDIVAGIGFVAGPAVNNSCILSIDSSPNGCRFLRNSSASGTSNWLLSDMGAGSRTLQGRANYRAF